MCVSLASEAGQACAVDLPRASCALLYGTAVHTVPGVAVLRITFAAGQSGSRGFSNLAMWANDSYKGKRDR